MYLVGFYSPKEKAGVTETALLVANWLRQNTSLSIAFVSNGILEKEPITKETVHKFAELSFDEQKQKIKELKSAFDIVVYDASSGLSADILKLLPMADRLFILGEDDSRFSETLHHVIKFNRLFDRKSRDLVNELHNDETYVLEHDNHMIGFAKPKQNIDDVGKLIYRDYSIYFLHRNYIDKYQELVAKFKEMPKEQLGKGAYQLGINFDKAILFQKYVQLREVCGQPYEEAIESIVPIFIKYDYGTILQQFQSEVYIAQIGFGLNR
ncbi:hypothetical protein [Effusibacillus consociatus]|uniref:Uncharacterized protein n=1 Tax=Effusibacillus consociatus TaxID=1117041 RepID=A0ABV9Q383_9BACL